MTKTIEFKSQEAFDAWLAEQGESVRVLNLATTAKKWSPWTGFLTNAKTYTVLYEETGKPRSPGARG